MLEVLDLACNRGDRPLFRALSFNLEPGALLHVRGENGCGKTTLLRTLCGLTQPAAGKIHWQGQSIQAEPESYNKQLCYVGHGNAIHGDLTAVENLQFEMCLSADADIDAQPILSGLGLGRIVGLPSKLLSQGQKRRVALARLSLQKRMLWILDEPFAALDTRAIGQLQDTLAQHLDRGGMCLLTSHQEVTLANWQVQTLNLS